VAPKPAPPSANYEFKKIIKLYKGGHFKAVLRKIRNFVQSFPSSDLTDDVLILSGDIFFQQNKYSDASSSYLSVIRSPYSSPRENYAKYKTAQCLVEQGQYNEALSLTDDPTSYNNKNQTLRFKSLQLRKLLLTRLGDSKDLLKTLSTLHKLDSKKGDPSIYQSEIYQVIDVTHDEATLNTFLDLNLSDKTKALILFKLANSFYDKGEFHKAESYYEKSMDLQENSKISEVSKQRLQHIQSRNKVMPFTIGVILPLEGSRSAIAQRALNALKLGLGIYGAQNSRFKVAILSSGNNPDTARLSTERLILEDHVIAIVGSLLSKTSAAVAFTSNQFSVPNISLSQRAHLTKIGPYVFRNSLTSQMMVSELVRTAIEKSHIKKVAILYPNDSYGIEYANLFWDEFTKHGGQIVGAQIYKSDETDFNSQLNRLFGTFYLEDRVDEYKNLLRNWKSKQKRVTSRTTPPNDLLPPIKDFDALFIPDTIKTLGQVAPSMPYHDVSDVVLMGTNLWYTNSLIKKGGLQVENSLFVHGIQKKDPKLLQSEFYSTFKSYFKESPGLLEIQAYDTGLILRQLILNGAVTREDLRTKLSQLQNFPSPQGYLNINSSREIIRPVYSFTVKDGAISVIK